MQNDKRKTIIIGATIIAITVIIPIILFILNLGKTATLQTAIAPSFATLTINDKKYKINSDLKFEPGDYKATISADGFKTKEVDLTLQDHQTTQLALYLDPNDGNIKWYYDHPEEYTLFAIANDTKNTQEAESYVDKYPISKILPINVVEINPTTYAAKEYRIDLGKFDQCKADEFCIKITDRRGNNYEEALNMIRQKGFDPDDYEIIYENNQVFDGPPARP